MKMKSLLIGLALVAGLMAQAADPLGAVKTVTPGVWTSSFNAAKEYAEANNVPMVVFWANPGCTMCEKLETACRGADFKAWMASRNLVMVFCMGTLGENKDCKVFAKDPNAKEFPYLAVYWPANTLGEEVYERFVGRSGKMGHGTSKSDALWLQFANAVDYCIPDWESGNPPPGPKPEPKPEPCVHAWDKGVETTPATCTKDGVRTFTCEKCLETKTEKITKLGHDYVEGVCTRCGKKQSTGPEINFDEPFDPMVAYKRSQSVNALVDGLDGYMGTAKITVGKINSKTRKVKVSASLSLFTGSKTSASLTVVPNENGTLTGTFKFKSPVGPMEFTIGYDDESKTLLVEADGEEASLEVGDVVLGGVLDTEEMFFSADIGEAEPLDNYDFVVDPPMGEPVYVKKGTKFSFDKVPSIKYKKYREDGETWYELVGLDDEVKTNVTGLKLSYTKTSGAFSGSFKVYASNESYTEKAPKLVSYKVTVKGVVVNGAGIGYTSVKIGKKTYTGTCQLD